MKKHDFSFTLFAAWLCSLPLAASFDIPPGTEVYIETRVKVAQTCTLYAVAEADGQLYMQSRETKVTLGGCGG